MYTLIRCLCQFCIINWNTSTGTPVRKQASSWLVLYVLYYSSMKNEWWKDLKRTSKTATLTEVVGDVVWDVDVAVAPLSPHAAAGGAGISVPLGLRVDGDVSLHHHGLIKVRGCRRSGVDNVQPGLWCFCDGCNATHWSVDILMACIE